MSSGSAGFDTPRRGCSAFPPAWNVGQPVYQPLARVCDLHSTFGAGALARCFGFLRVHNYITKVGRNR